MIGYDEALTSILSQSRRLDTRRCPAAQALGHVLAEPVASPDYLPPFDNSAMDGFALLTGGATLRPGSEFDVAGAQAAGDAHVRVEPQECGNGGAWEIMTGARMPEGMDAVLPVEQVEVLERDGEGRPLRIRLSADVGAGQHVRLRGEDVMHHAEVMRAGEQVQPQHVMLLAALGVAEVAVVRRPRVAIITTGRELVDDPLQALSSGQIRNSNGPFLAARVAAAGAEVVCRETVGDEQEAFLTALDRALHAGADMVLSTGAVSMGRHDFVPDALRGIGADIHFHKVRIRPGKPLLFARLHGGQLFFGLPGNPVSSAVGLRFFAEPALRAMLGMAPERPLRVPLAAAYAQRAVLRFHLKGRLAYTAAGGLKASVLPGQESFRILPMLASNAWVVVPETVSDLEAGDLVDVYGLGHLQSPQPGEGAT